MSPIPGEPHRSKDFDLTTKDGKKVKLKIPGMQPVEPIATEERGSEEPPRDDPRPPLNPQTTGF